MGGQHAAVFELDQNGTLFRVAGYEETHPADRAFEPFGCGDLLAQLDPILHEQGASEFARTDRAGKQRADELRIRELEEKCGFRRKWPLIPLRKRPPLR